MSEMKSINFLRGVPANDVLEWLISKAAEGYKKAIQKYGVDVLQYGHFNGFAPLRELIGQRHHVDPQRVVVGNGGMEVISLFLKSLPKNANIVIEEATYDRVVLDAQRYGLNLIGVELNGDGVDLDQLQIIVKGKRIDAFYGIPFHQNPTGINYSEENIQAVETICKDNDVICAWDICYESLRYDGRKNSPIQVADWGPVLIDSYTKTISPGTKCGYIVLPENYVDHMVNVIANTRINPNLPTQAFIADFITSGEYETFLDKICRFYQPRMTAINEALELHFSGAYPAELSGGFFTGLTLKTITPDREKAFIQQAQDAGVGVAAAWNAVAPNFRQSKQQNGFYTRLTFPAFDADLIRWGISALKKVTENFS